MTRMDPRGERGGHHRGEEIKKGGRWMPRLPEAKKDVDSCEKPRGTATSFDPGISEWGNPSGRRPDTGLSRGERGELKHLSTRRKRKKYRCPE